MNHRLVDVLHCSFRVFSWRILLPQLSLLMASGSGGKGQLQGPLGSLLVAGGPRSLRDPWAILSREENQPAFVCPASSPLRAIWTQILFELVPTK